jgi:hypothetical protein
MTLLPGAGRGVRRRCRRRRWPPREAAGAASRAAVAAEAKPPRRAVWGGAVAPPPSGLILGRWGGWVCACADQTRKSFSFRLAPTKKNKQKNREPRGGTAGIRRTGSGARVRVEWGNRVRVCAPGGLGCATKNNEEDCDGGCASFLRRRRTATRPTALVRRRPRARKSGAGGRAPTQGGTKVSLDCAGAAKPGFWGILGTWGAGAKKIQRARTYPP